MKMKFPIAVLFALITACSGGGGGGADNGGIGGTGFSQGVITDTQPTAMTATVAGTLWETDGTTIFEGGPTNTAADLEPGRGVLIEGTLGATQNLATVVEFYDVLVGPVSNLDPVNPMGVDEREFTILGIRVVIERVATEFVGTDFDTLSDNDNVRVSGLLGPDGVTATRIELVSTVNEVEFRGTASDLSEDGMGNGSFDVDDINVDFFDMVTNFFDFPTATRIMEGDFVAIQGDIPNATSPDVDASDITFENRGIEDAGDLDDVEIEGLVTDFAGLGSFRVGGQLVSTFVQGVVFEPPTDAFVQDGARIEVEGDIRGGVLLANQVKLREAEVRVDAAIADPMDVDAAAGTFSLLGIDFSTDSATRFEDVPGMAGLAGIGACNFLETQGILIDGVVRATRIKCETAVDDVSVRGRFDAFDALGGTFDLLGVQIETTAGTSFNGFPAAVMDEASFYLFLAANRGELVEATDGGGDATIFGVAVDVDREESD